MQSFFSHYWAIIITGIMLVIPALYPHPAISSVCILMTATIWYIELSQTKKNKNDAVILVKRAHQLKKFSGELQQMVKTELGLVQEDVIRIRGVVSDSIMILQTSTQSIRQSFDIFCEQGVNLQRTQENLESAASKIDNTATIIQSVQRFSEQIHLLSANLEIEAKQVSNGVNTSHTQTSNTQASNTQKSPTLTSVSVETPLHTCSEISKQSGQLEKELSTSTETINAIIAEVKSLASQGTSVSNYQSAKDNVTNNISDIVRALQFEDIVCQMSERIASHIGDIRLLVEQLSHLYENELSTNFEEELQEARKKMDVIKEKLSRESAKVIVSQQNMDEGDIELF